MQLSPESREDLSWWVRTLPQAYKQIDVPIPDIEVTTDASKIGWETVGLGETTQGLWSESEKLRHKNELEMLAAHFALRCFKSHIKGKHVKVNSDNSTAMCYLNSMGGTKSPPCNKLVQDIWTWCMQNKVLFSASHLPGVLNVEADQRSRQFNERTEWHLREDVFQQITKLWGTPKIDLFASKLNSQLPKYASWTPDPGATHVDAFSFAWTGIFPYLFPPFCLIARCHEKIGERRSTGSHCSAPMANTSLLATTVKPSHSNSCYSTSAQGFTDTSSQQDGTPLKDQAKDGGMSVILLASWRGGTKKQYNEYIKKWTKFCAERETDQFLPLLVDVLDFLTELYEKGFTYGAINTARSALSSFVQLDDGCRIGKTPLISRLLKGVFQSRAPKPKYTEVWDVVLS